MTSWTQTEAARRLGIRYPIIQGPFGGGLSTTRLAAAVSNAGGLGSFGAHNCTPDEIRALGEEMRALTAAPFALNLWVPLPGEPELTLTAAEFSAAVTRARPYYETFGLPLPSRPTSYTPHSFEVQLEALIAARPPVASFVFGAPPAAAMAELKRREIVTIGAATTVDEAVALERAGFDLILATGSDAGGHRPSFLRPALESLVGTFALVPQVVDAVKVPVIAAGGIGDARGIVAAFALGASAVQLGTVFLACDESAASEAHKAELVKPSARHTVLTRVFSGRHARGIRNRLVDELSPREAELPSYPIQSWLMSPVRRAAAKNGRADYQSLWAGQAASFARRQSATECFNRLLADTERQMKT